MAVELTTISQIKVILSGNAPTTATLSKGQIAIGVVGAKPKIYGSNGTEILDLTGEIYSAKSGGGLAFDPATNEFSIATGGVTEAMLATALMNKINSKANETDVLTKTNTTAFTPSADYHPATKKYTDDSISALGALFTLKGRVDTFGDLPTTGNKAGHVWLVGLVTDLDMTEYVYTSGGTWEKLGTVATVDLSNYYTKAQVDQLFSDFINNDLPDIIGEYEAITAAAQPVMISGEIADLRTRLTSYAAKSGGGILVDENSQLMLDTTNITVTMTVVEI